MSKKITIQVPLAGALFGGHTMDEMFTAPPPCFYCGAPVDTHSEHHFIQKGQYQIQYWGRGRKFGSPMLGDVVDSKGAKLKGKYTIKLPYCPEHIAPVKAFAIINIVGFVLGIGGGLGMTALVYFKEGLEGGELLLLLCGLPFFFVSFFMVLGLGIKAHHRQDQPQVEGLFQKQRALRRDHLKRHHPRRPTNGRPDHLHPQFGGHQPRERPALLASQPPGKGDQRAGAAGEGVMQQTREKHPCKSCQQLFLDLSALKMDCSLINTRKSKYNKNHIF